VRDPLSGRTVVIAPGRARRPGAFLGAIEDATPEELESCPFCAGREDRTPPQVLVLPENGPWTVRVVPNLYPALERQEVVVHSPRHVRTFAELEDGELELVAQAWRQRFAAANGEGFPYVHAMINEGRFAGASLAHSHSQLVWFREPPPAVRRESFEGCPVCELVSRADQLVAEDSGIAAVCHPAGRAPFELLVAPRAHDPEPTDEFAGALRLLRETVRRLRTLEGPVPWNAWLHQGPHWHIEVVPRLTVFAGLELGAEIYVNVVAPERAAAALRDAG
jgi:UDPglucose--hexose-1-phosphate uridylyltransferase